MHNKGPIKAVNFVIRDWCSRFSAVDTYSRTVGLAKSKLTAKFEEPETAHATRRRTDAWERWIGFDEGLQPRGIIGPNWAKARLLIHEILSEFRMGDLRFTNGSSFIPLGNNLSLACKLEADWTITADCESLFAKYSYWHRALKFAAKKRFNSYCRRRGWNLKLINRRLWDRFKTSKEPAYQIYCFKLHCILTFVGGNRWSTVPKNNLKDRSICLEPLCNMLVQRAVGLGIRNSLKEKLGIDLDNLADVHRCRIKDTKVSTIDLSDCSDAISMWLTRYLIPRRVFNKILACRSDMTLGPDDNYYVINKVSSMGNGFTFDLMSLILTALTRSFDPTSTVFGDDIICSSSSAREVVSNLQIAGFVVNLDKTNIDTGYRESCGAHFMDGFGYVVTFDLRWLTSDHDLIVACNKVAILSSVYGEPFESLRAAIWSHVPRPWLGATVKRQTVNVGRPPSFDLDTYIRYGPPIQVNPSKGVLKSLRRKLSHLQKPGNISVATGFVSKTRRGRDNLKPSQWSEYFMYLHSGRVESKFPALVKKSILVARVDGEQIGPIYTLLP